MSEPTPPTSPEPVPPASASPPNAPITRDDSSSQALSEALRSSFQIVKWLMAGLVVLFLFSGSFIVQPNEVVVLLRFGEPVGRGDAQLKQPGYHWALPYPIDEKVRIPIGKSHTVTSATGWHATTPELEAANQDPLPTGFLSPEADGYTLTADGNIIHARGTVKYRISDPIRYTFGFANVAEILTNVVNNALFYASARVMADAALYRDKTGFRDLVLQRVRDKVDELQLGITLEPSDVETKAPVDVRAAFEQVNAAEQERSEAISNARGYSDALTRKAIGEAKARISGGITSSNRLVSAVRSEARAFNEQLPHFLENPRLFKERLFVAAMERVLTNSRVKFILPERFDELRLQLSREPEKRQAEPRP